MFKDAVKAACEYANISLAEAARRYGTSPQNFGGRIEKEKMKQAEIEHLAEVLGCEYQAYFVFPSGSVVGKDSIPMSSKLKTIFTLSGVKLFEVASFFNISQPSFSSRLKTDAMRQCDLQKIAEYCKCEYVSRFVFPDGHIINTNG